MRALAELLLPHQEAPPIQSTYPSADDRKRWPDEVQRRLFDPHPPFASGLPEAVLRGDWP